MFVVLATAVLLVDLPPPPEPPDDTAARTGDNACIADDVLVVNALFSACAIVNDELMFPSTDILLDRLLSGTIKACGGSIPKSSLVVKADFAAVTLTCLDETKSTSSL